MYDTQPTEDAEQRYDGDAASNDEAGADVIAEEGGMTREEYLAILEEREEQPEWRRIADKEMDYADGNQLDSELLRRQAMHGIPPAVEDLIGPAILSVQGYEASMRTDWRVTAAGGTGGQDVADALNYKLNEAERESGADRACSEAFRPQAAVGIGWVEVSRDSDPFAYPYRCQAVHRNEIAWDMTSGPDQKNMRWLLRHRWLRPERIALSFPQHRELILGLGKHGASWWGVQSEAQATGASTGLNSAWAEGRGQTIEEARWYNRTTRELQACELWYRRWVSVPVMMAPDGRVVEFDENNPAHVYAMNTGVAKVTRAPVPRIRRSYWLGPHKLSDEASPYPHCKFPYVRFDGFREDRTGVPYGYVRGMVYPQDSLNSGTSKLRWGMSVVRTERTKGAVDMTDEQFRSQISRSDADIVLNQVEMAKPGARFEVKRDYTLTQQHFEMLTNARASIERVSGVSAGFAGRQGTATSGLQEQTQVEQSNMSLGHLMDNFRTARSQVGELLMSMLIEDMGTGEQTIIIEGDAVREDRTVVLNKPESHPETGLPYLSNDLHRTRLKVALQDVPSTASYRGQQLNAMSEAVKSLPDQYKVAVMPFLVSLMDVPFKKDVVEAIRATDQKQTPEQIEEQIKQAVAEALVKAGNDNRIRELDLREREVNLKYSPEKMQAELESIVAGTVVKGVQAAFASMQAGSQIAAIPQIAPVADAIMQGAGYKRPSPGGDDPNFPMVSQPLVPVAGEMPLAGAPDVAQNTSPLFPPVPDDGASPMAGIETADTADNLQGEPF